MSGVVVEGPDGSGKTSLVRELRNRLHYPVIHVVQPKRPNVTQMLQLLDCGPAIFDRFQWSPIAYGDALRDGPELSSYDLWALDGYLMSRGYVLLFCVTDVLTMLENNRKAPQLWEAVKNYAPLSKLVARYSRLYETSELRRFVFDYQKTETEEVISYVNAFAREAAPEHVLGHPRPKIWFVGDERADKGSKGVHVPFYDEGISDKLLSGTLLHRALTDAGLTWGRGVALSNSANVDLRAVYSALGEPERVVALGAAANGRLHKAGIDGRVVAHPQWWRRFKYSDPDGYTELLKEATR